MIANVRLIEPVSMIVLTGGPCSGKSSSLAYLTERLSDHGFMVSLPETATLITSTGIDRRKMDRTRQVVMFEETIFDMQLAFEETYKKAVTGIFPDRRKVILLDRGIMDIKAFIPHEDFRAMLKKRGLSEVNVRDRYNGVIHLVTAAEGAEEYYTGENNAARIESPEEARSHRPEDQGKLARPSPFQDHRQSYGFRRKDQTHVRDHFRVPWHPPSP